MLGRSKIVGSPVADLLKWHHATVTVCHSKTKNLPEVVGDADILVVAIGKPGFVKGSWVKEGAVVIDCGINAIPDETKKSGQRALSSSRRHLEAFLKCDSMQDSALSGTSSSTRPRSALPS